MDNRRTLARYVLAQPRALVDEADACVIDGDFVEAPLASELAGSDSWTSGHLTLGAGVGLWITSVTGLVVAADRKRLIRSAGTAAGDDIVLERDVASTVMWTAAAAVASGIELALIFGHDPGPDPVWPHPFPALTSSTSTPTTPTRNPS